MLFREGSQDDWYPFILFPQRLNLPKIEEKENTRRFKMRGAFTVWLSVQDNAAWLFGIASLFFDKLVKVGGI